MPVCCVPNCQSGYRNEPKCALFLVPKDPAILAAWRTAIPRVGRTIRPGKDYVCERHFSSDLIVRRYNIPLKSNEVFTSDRSKTKLKRNAVPSIFYDTLQNSSHEANPSKDQNCNLEEQIESKATIKVLSVDELLSPKLESSSVENSVLSPLQIKTESDILKNLNLLNFPEHWTCSQMGNFAVIQDWRSFIPESGNFTKRIVVDKDLNIQVFIGMTRIKLKDFQKLERIEDLEKLVAVIQ